MFQFDTTKPYGKWTVLDFSHKQRKGDHFDRFWMCRCECGTVRSVNEKNLRDGLTSSCGCSRKKDKLKNHHYRCWTSWARMIQRCCNPNHKNFHHYGARGITVCERWRDSFEDFFEDMGERPQGHTLDRINNDVGYRKDNCRWATSKQQNFNRRDNRLITYSGVTRPLTEWAEILNVLAGTLFSRVSYGWTDERIIGIPIKKYKR